ncbi:unnamed protein product, partial [Brugia timori]|uniref:Ovule protein n=1 Tax=Brugia timori TaxID=42155 RepID=A0A0R3QVR4_9BILA
CKEFRSHYRSSSISSASSRSSSSSSDSSFSNRSGSHTRKAFRSQSPSRHFCLCLSI